MCFMLPTSLHVNCANSVFKIFWWDVVASSCFKVEKDHIFSVIFIIWKLNKIFFCTENLFLLMEIIFLQNIYILNYLLQMQFTEAGNSNQDRNYTSLKNIHIRYEFWISLTIFIQMCNNVKNIHVFGIILLFFYCRKAAYWVLRIAM